jgi:hypothetical protein
MALIFNPDTGQLEDDEAPAPSGSLNPGDPGYRLSPWAPGYDPGPTWNNGIAPGAPSPRYDYNGGSAPDQPLTPGYTSWEWEGPQSPMWDTDNRQWNRGVWQERQGPSGTAPPSEPTGTTGSDGFGYLTEPFTGTAPSWQAGPTYKAPTWEPPPPFSYKQFQAPTPDSIYADPSYQFREGQGRQALQQSAGAKGVLRTGGTLKDLINYGQNAASQEYSNIYGRAVDAHNMGLEQELGTYGVNYGVGKDERDYLFDASKAEFAPQQRENEQMNQRQFDAFLANFDIFDRNRRRAGDYLTWAADQGGK